MGTNKALASILIFTPYYVEINKQVWTTGNC